MVATGQSRAPDGVLRIGETGADLLAATYGTPLLAFDARTFDATVGRFIAACAPHGVTLAYAAKALLVSGIVQRFIDHPSVELDVCSLGEIVTAERVDFPATRMYLHGCGKSDGELDAALEGRVGSIIVDGFDELERLAERADERTVGIGLRINTGIEAHTHEFVRTGGENTKFGIAPDALERALDVFDAHPNLTLTVLHGHIGSQLFDEAPYAANLDVLLELAARAHERGRSLGKLLLGGGFGVSEDITAPPAFDLDTIISELAARAVAGAKRLGIAIPHLGIEPGRALVAAAGTSLYTVVAIKDSGSRRFVVIDGGIADNPRPALYGAFHQPLVARSAARGPLRRVTVAGRSCENDEMVDAELPDDLRVGDLLALCTAGAYTYSMASNYNRFTRPPIVEVDGASHRLLARRETIDDVLRCDIVD